MSEFIQVGTAAMRDPLTGDFLPSVPLYIRAEDQAKVETPVFDAEIMKTLAEKYRAYRKEARKQKRPARAVRLSVEPETEEDDEGQKKTR